MYELRTDDHPDLRQPSLPVELPDAELPALVAALADYIHGHRAVGMAAPQLGVHKRVIVVDLSNGKRPRPFAMINPVVRTHGATRSVREGCLSLPGREVTVPRFTAATVSYTNFETGEREERYFGEWPARVIQHEVDHLDGKLLLDVPGMKLNSRDPVNAKSRAVAMGSILPALALPLAAGLDSPSPSGTLVGRGPKGRTSQP